MINVKKLRKIFFPLVVTFFVATALSCVSNPATHDIAGRGQAIPFLPGARHGTLPNGLTYYIYENQKPKDRAFLTLAVNAGSVLEADNERGLAHFLEHMAFNGTARFPESDLVEYLRSLGMRFGADLNAYTSYDETVYELETPVEQDENSVRRIPQKALEIIEDWTHSININEKDVDEERGVIMEEYRLHLGATERMQRFLFPRLFAGSQYANREPIGLPEIIQNAPASRLQEFYKRWYVSPNMAIIFSGDFDGAALEADLFAMYAADSISHPVEKNFKRPEYYLPPPKKGNRQYEVFIDPELSRTSISIFYKNKWTPQKNTIETFKDELTDVIVDMILAERFNDETMQSETPFLNCGAGITNYVRNSQHYIFAATAKSGRSAEALDKLLLIKENAVRYGFLESEIDRAKKSILAILERSFNERDKQESSGFVKQFAKHFLANEYVSSAEWDLQAAEKILPSVSAKNILARFKSYFSNDDIFVFIYGPSSEEAAIPSKNAIAQAIAASSALVIEKPKDAAFDSELLDAEPDPGSIAAEKYDKDLAITTWTLSNGAEVIIKETENQSDQILLYATARGGFTSVPANDAISAHLATEMESASGLGKWKLTDLSKKLSDKQASFSFNVSSFTRNIQASSSNKDKKTMFEMLYLAFTDPRIDKKAVDVMLDKYKTSLALRKENPDSYFHDELIKISYDNNPYFSPMEVADLKNVNIKTAQTFLERCVNPSDWVFVFSGNISIDELRAFVETYIASIPQKKPFDEWANIAIKRPSDIVKIINKGKEEKALVYSTRVMTRPWTEQENMTAYVLNEYLDIVMIQEIREKLGGVYSISASVSQSILPPGGELSIDVYFGCDPKRVDELNAAIDAEIAKIANGTINRETFEKAQLALKKSFEQSLQSNLYLSRTMANYRKIFSTPLANIFKRPDFYEKVTPKDMQNMINILLQKKPFTLIMYPDTPAYTNF